MDHSPLPSNCDISFHLLENGSDQESKADSCTQNFRELQILGKACAQVSIAAVALEVTAYASEFATCVLCLPHLKCDRPHVSNARPIPLLQESMKPLLSQTT